MISSKAIQVIQTFSEDEFRKFGLFVSSPYFNKENILVKFYELLKKYYPEFNNRNFEKEKLFGKLYPGKEYNDGRMRNILSGTFELAEKFTAVNHLQNKKLNSSIALMSEYSERKMEKLFEKAEEDAGKILNSIQVKNEEYYYDAYRMISEKRKFRRKQKSSLYSADDLLRSAGNNLTVSFLISMLRSHTNIANSNQKMFNFDNDSSLNELEIFLEKERIRFKDITYMQLYYKAFKLARTLDEKYFYELKKITDSSSGELSDNDMRDIFTYLTNYCYYMISKGNTHFKKEHFLLHKENILRSGYKGERKFLDHIKYLSIVITGLDAGEEGWVESFIEQYKNELDERNVENSYNFSKALVFYHKKEYSHALDWALKVKTDDLSYKHQLKSLYLKIYFDMNEIEPFYSHVDSYRHFLVNEKHIPELTRHAIGGYVNLAKKLFDLKNDTSEKGSYLFMLKKEITESESLINKEWLMVKTEEIEKAG